MRVNDPTASCSGSHTWSGLAPQAGQIWALDGKDFAGVEANAPGQPRRADPPNEFTMLLRPAAGCSGWLGGLPSIWLYVLDTKSVTEIPLSFSRFNSSARTCDYSF